jgi:hypothetical protein
MICVKKLHFFNLILLIFILGCKKSNLESIGNSLTGKWVFTEYYIAPGGPGQWQPVTPPGQTIEFKPDGRFLSSLFLKDATHFKILDSVTIKFQPVSTVSGYILMAYSIDTAARELLMYPVNPFCIEGCSNKFKR